MDTHKRDIKKETQVSFEAGQIVGKIYDALIKQYKFIKEKDDDGVLTERAKKEQQSLNRLCVRLVFCLYAEDSGLFENKNQFHDYLCCFTANKLREGIINLFKVLDQPIEESLIWYVLQLVMLLMNKMVKLNKPVPLSVMLKREMKDYRC